MRRVNSCCVREKNESNWWNGKTSTTGRGISKFFIGGDTTRLGTSFLFAHSRKSTARTRTGNRATIRFTEVLTRHDSDYIQIRSPVYLSHSAGRYAAKRFRKAQCPIIERLTNSLMMNGRNNGKKLLAVRIVAHAFEIVCATPTNSTIQLSNSDANSQFYRFTS